MAKDPPRARPYPYSLCWSRAYPLHPLDKGGQEKGLQWSRRYRSREGWQCLLSTMFRLQSNPAIAKSTPGEVTSQSPSCVKSQRGLDLSPTIKPTLTTKALSRVISGLRTVSSRSRTSSFDGSSSNSRRGGGLGVHLPCAAMLRVLHPSTTKLYLRYTSGT